jgi:hypothetical protein
LFKRRIFIFHSLTHSHSLFLSPFSHKIQCHPFPKNHKKQTNTNNNKKTSYDIIIIIMTVYNAAFINTQLSKPTSIFGLRLWVLIGILIGSIIVLTLFLLSLCLTSRRRKNHHKTTKLNHHSPIISKEIQEITHAPPSSEIHVVDTVKLELHNLNNNNNNHRVVSTSGESRGNGSVSETASSFGSVGPEVSHLGWGRWYTLRELEAATNGLCEENVIGEGGYGIVYSGVLPDGVKIAVKNLLNNKYVS